jgi:hypothetical protein
MADLPSRRVDGTRNGIVVRQGTLPYILLRRNARLVGASDKVPHIQSKSRVTATRFGRPEKYVYIVEERREICGDNSQRLSRVSKPTNFAMKKKMAV